MISLGRWPINRAALASIAFWVLMLIATPIAFWMLGQTALEKMIVLGVLAHSAASLTALSGACGTMHTLRMAVPIILLAWLAEFIGSHTGFPFGSYYYTGVMQPQLGGVPILIPLAWLMMFPPAWAVAKTIVPPGQFGSTGKERAIRALVAALAFTAWDLYLDPQMVTWGVWVWEVPGLYFGIPFVNFLGWMLVSFLISFAFLPKNLPVVPLIWMYAITWVMQFIGQMFFWGLPGPAIFGLLGMGVMLFLAYRRGCLNLMEAS